MTRRELEFPGLVALVLALGVSLSLVVGIAGAAIGNTPMSEGRAQLFAAIFGAVVGAIATYLGAGRRTNGHGGPAPPPGA